MRVLLLQDALDDFTRATHKRSQSVHQMAAMYASSTMSAMSMSSGKAGADSGDGRDELDASLPGEFSGGPVFDVVVVVVGVGSR